MSAEPTSWKITLPCTRAEAEAIDAASDLAIEAVLMTTEEVEDDVERWRLDAYVDREPDAATIAAIHALVPSASGRAPVVEALSDEDWVALSQQGLEPIREGRFVVHTSAHPANVDAAAGERAFLINAGQAFGTGHHGTTSGCLAMLDGLAREGRDYHRVIDLGTGTGLLAFAARHLWPAAAVTGTDIDPIAIDVTRDNMALNAVADVRLVVADGTRDPAIADQAPYDLVIANILAGPLIAMAPEVAGIAALGGTIVLAGLLSNQAAKVVDAYVAQGAREIARDVRGDWTILHLQAATDRVAPTGTDASRRGDWATDGR
ncbi:MULTISPECIES: 50S ribosomal protein L11 methyltransferase [unclassified Sphingomonas]|jgi:ribosomal protein L11 methyltransferase|uniref:50S ribosomal protein L11 methyltransferase n=1 Tax=unclassified Sphingomonas TaxID=196159 RepID=UPI000E1047E1|nr:MULTISPECIES: 50S ribosomal protein L11 methyltransferase [unclassified Sphingomonas]AXJ95977.1 50S ribosomal protein L11 methyltransferase [Sphingomonas sp. FARSPH]